MVRDQPAKISQVLDDGGEKFDRDGAVTATIGRLLTEYVFDERMPKLPEDSIKQQQLLGAIGAIRSLELKLPREVFIRNSTVLPRVLERLYLILLAMPDIDEWIPPQPWDDKLYPSLERIFLLLQQEVEGRKGLRYRFDASLAVRWIWQWNLRRMIDARLDWQKRNQKQGSAREAIRSIIRAVEHRLRFDLVRSLRAYHDVLAAVLIAKDRAQDAESLQPLHLYLECGGYKPSLLSLLSLGFSRTSALILLDTLKMPDSLTPEQCRERILRSNLKAKSISELIQREVRQLLGSVIK
jgi:hypothetical protein